MLLLCVLKKYLSWHGRPRKSIFKKLKIRYNEGMDRTTLTDFFKEVETTEEYNGYFCSIAEAISIVVLGSLCGLKLSVRSSVGEK